MQKSDVGELLFGNTKIIPLKISHKESYQIDLDSIPDDEFLVVYFYGGTGPFSSGACLNIPGVANIHFQIAYRDDEIAYRCTWGGSWTAWKKFTVTPV